MSSCTKRMIGAVLLTTTALAVAAPAYAQDAGPEGADGAGTEIVVTAQKRDERLLDVPVAISVVSTAALADQNLVTLRDYYQKIPGLAINGGQTEQRASNLSLRGVTAGNGSAATVAVTIDDVPFTSGSQLAQSPLPDLDPSDLARIEVLRGPQGTLYGASSLGGLLKYVTVTPDTRDFSGRLEVGANKVEYGDFGYVARGAVNVPVISDRLAIRASAVYRQDAPYIDSVNPTLRRDLNDNRTKGGRVAVFAEPVDGLRLNFSAMTQHAKLYSTPSLRLCSACGTGPFRDPVEFDPLFGKYTNNVGPSTRETRFTLYQARGELDLGFADLASISAWGRYGSVTDLDVSNTFGFLYPFYGITSGGSASILNRDRTRKFTQEIRLASKSGGTVEWLVGGFYTKEHILVQQVLGIAGGSTSANALVSDAPASFEEKAVFADLTYKFSDRFDIQVGGRYSKNKQTTGGSTTIDGPAVPIFGPSSVDDPSASSEDNFTWLVTPRFRFTPDMMIYARVATGYRPGGPNPILPGVPSSFSSDTVTSYEIGLKGKIAPANLTFDATLFQTDWDDVQLMVTDTATQFTYLTNGRTARSRGVELQAQWQPADQLSIDATATFTDAKLTADPPQLPGADSIMAGKGDRLPGSARFTATLSAQKDWSIGGDWEAFLGGSYAFVGKRFGELAVAVPPTDPAAPNEAFGPRAKMPSYSMVDLRAGVKDDAWSLSFYVRNLFNKMAILEATTRGGTQAPTGVFAQPRTYGFTLARNF